MLFAFLFQVFFPTVAFALTGGPSQPETQSFTPAGVSELVDPFSGNFSYNIPLMDVGGYPIGLSYSSGISMEQEASWVGLGWNINPGVINRNVRGIPDDFRGDEVVKTFHMKPNRTFGVGASVPIEFFGVSDEKLKAIKAAKAAGKSASPFSLSLGASAKYNNYSGVALDIQVSPSISGGLGSKSGYTAGLGFSAGNSGVGISPSVSFTKQIHENEKKATSLTTRIGSSFNSRTGVQELSFGASAAKGDSNTEAKRKRAKKEKSGESEVLKTIGGHVSFSAPSYTPSISNSFKNRSFSVSASIGYTAYGVDGQARVNGYYSEQLVRDNVIEAPSYGYLYYQDGINSPNSVLDFNREKDIGYSEEVKNLPVTAATYDVFSVSGEEIGGSYRLFRNDVGTLFDNESTNTTDGISIVGPEFSVGGVAKGGVNITVNTAYTSNKKWEDGNAMAKVLKFRAAKTSEAYEPVYFRKSGEKNVMSDESFFNKFGGFEGLSFNLEGSSTMIGSSFNITNKLLGSKEGAQIASGAEENLNKIRQARNEAIVHYTAAEAKKYGMFPSIRNYDWTSFSLGDDGTYETTTPDERFDEQNPEAPTARKAHHLSEINVFSGDGRRYVYSDPLYNFIKEEVSFATDNNGDGELVQYTNKDESEKNTNGLDHYFNKIVTPAYPTAFLLSAIVSSDYLDIDEVQGPSDEDLGSYTKFNYTKLVGNHRWRTPIEEGQATLNEGFKTKTNSNVSDNKGIYVYGEKEIKYLHSIESKTHIAEFELEDRHDGKGVKSRRGGIGSGSLSLKRLKEIRLYSKKDKLENANPVPIKTVHFKYSYNLCAGVSNNENTGSETGKLTLEKVYFTYGNSQRGTLSPYEFAYGEFNGELVNPDYQRNENDRWGSYQANTGTPNNTEFPYTSQVYQNGRYDADRNAAAWNLTAITLPSGGIIKVEYEADDYAYVQDKKAMQMFKVEGFCELENDLPSNKLYGDVNLTSVYKTYKYLKLKFLPIIP
ncbi:MAG: hypothetical protein JKY48_10875 [Flavobacteriales bacterium]|nr:hypothetical protein [Flavobacteriales bacterium]